LETKKFNMSSKRKEYHVDDHSKKAATFFVACEPNQATRVKIPDAMRAKGNTDVEATNRTLQMQVRHEVEKIKGEAGPDPPALAAASSLLALATVATMARPALQTISANQMVAPVIAVSGIDASILQSPERKVRKTSHQVQIGKQNERKRKAIYAQAHARVTTLVAEERAKPREDCQTTAQVIAQVHGEFSARGYGVTLRKNTINRYVALGMVGTFPLARGYQGMMPRQRCTPTASSEKQRSPTPLFAFHVLPLMDRPSTPT
jgi:hypothetical protein